MRCIGHKIQPDGKTVLITETKRFLRKPKVREFCATRRIAGRFWQWLELPDKILVPDLLSFQLNEWLEETS